MQAQSLPLARIHTLIQGVDLREFWQSFSDGFPDTTAIAGDSQTRNLTVPLTFLDSGSYTATQIADGTSDRTFSDVTTRTVTAADSLAPALRGNGGFVARLVPATNATAILSARN